MLTPQQILIWSSVPHEALLTSNILISRCWVHIYRAEKLRPSRDLKFWNRVTPHARQASKACYHHLAKETKLIVLFWLFFEREKKWLWRRKIQSFVFYLDNFRRIILFALLGVCSHSDKNKMKKYNFPDFLMSIYDPSLFTCVNFPFHFVTTNNENWHNQPLLLILWFDN